MTNLTTQFKQLFESNERFQQKLSSYTRAMKSPDWQFMVDAVQMIRGQMAMDMFSARYTKLTPSEKDVVQRTYFNINQILDFLGNPEGWVGRKKKHYSDLQSKVNQAGQGGKHGRRNTGTSES